MTAEKQYYLKWSNFSDNILTSLESLRGDEDFVDVTIACEGHSLKAHKVVLSACSLYIKKLLKVSLNGPLLAKLAITLGAYIH
jgi:hypothetical protein